MTTITDRTGGPAFPVTDLHHANGQVQYGSNGMTLRDYFAIHGPEPTRQQVEDYMVGWTNRDTRLARSMLRYLEADAMLKAREV